jgi:hypothetical protein
MDGCMNARDLKIRVLPALLAGTVRQAIDFPSLFDGLLSSTDPKAVLKALVLTGQALRFERPAPPSRYAVTAQRVHARRNVPEALRPGFVRLFGDGRTGLPPQDSLSLAMALTLERQHVQPHPFDFPRLDGFLRAHVERLGPEVGAWMGRDKAGGETPSYFDIEACDDSNWSEASPARRQRYVADRRRQDAGAARALVEAVWTKEGADIRLRLLQALRLRLSAADAPFLESAINDRAPKVRALVERYLSRLPGATGENPALASIVARIVKGKARFFSARITLKLETPATVTTDNWQRWVDQAFEDVELEELAQALGLSAAEMIAAAAQDKILAAAIALLAFRQDDSTIACQAYESLSEVSPWFEGRFFGALEVVEPTARRELAEFLARKALAAGTLTPSLLARAHQVIEGPASESLMEDILRGPIFSQEPSAEEANRAFLAPLAALCPRVKRPELREALARADPLQIRPILQFLDILDNLEKVHADD